MRFRLFALLALACPAAAQTTWYVAATGSGPGSGTFADPFVGLQYALAQPTVVDGDTLLVGPGTYLEAVDLGGKTLTLRSTAGAAQTVVDAGGLGSTLSIAAGEGPETVVEGFTFTGGGGTLDTSGRRLGGGVYLEGTSPLLRDCVIRDNAPVQTGAGDQGMGLYSGGGSPTLEGCTFSGQDGFVQGGGGAAFVGGAPRLIDCRFEGNGAGSYGGGAYFEGCSPTLIGGAFEDNRAWWSGGGGLAFLASDASLTGVCISGNRGHDADGGGVMVTLGSTVRMYDCTLSGNAGLNWRTGGAVMVESGRLEVRGGRVEGNDSYRGGGIASFGDLYVEGVTLSANRAASTASEPNDGDGGAVWVDDVFGGSATLVGCLIEGNVASNDGTFLGRGGGVFGPAVLDRCTLVENRSSNGGGPLDGVASVSNSILRSNVPPSFPAPAAGVQWSNVEGGAPGVGNIDADPLFWDPEGGDWRLQPGSPCIDAGDPAAAPDPDGSVADMGAFPFDPEHCPEVSSYCTAGTTANGCSATMSSLGTASQAAGAPFLLVAGSVEGQVQGLIFWGRAAAANPWGAGSSSYLCVAAPVRRTPVQSSGGTAGACDGVLSLDFNGWMQAFPAKAPAVGEVVYAQAWFRDPPSPKQTSLSDALRFSICP